MISYFANPQRFLSLSRILIPLFAGLAVLTLGIGIYLSFASPEDYQQGDTVRIMYVHVPAAWMALFAYLCLGAASFFGLIFRHALADAAAKAAAPLGAAFTFLALVTGSLWGRPMWGTWWVWDGRLTSVFVLFLFYIAYLALHAAMDDEQKAAKAAAVLALVGLINLPIIKFSVDWWNTLHQPASLLRAGGPAIHGTMLWALLTMGLGYKFTFLSVWCLNLQTEIHKKRVQTLMIRAAGRA